MLINAGRTPLTGCDCVSLSIAHSDLHSLTHISSREDNNTRVVSVWKNVLLCGILSNRPLGIQFTLQHTADESECLEMLNPNSISDSHPLFCVSLCGFCWKIEGTKLNDCKRATPSVGPQAVKCFFFTKTQIYKKETQP